MNSTKAKIELNRNDESKLTIKKQKSSVSFEEKFSVDRRFCSSNHQTTSIDTFDSEPFFEKNRSSKIGNFKEDSPPLDTKQRHNSDSVNPFPKTISHPNISQRDSFGSTTNEKVSLMTSVEQSSVVQPLLTDLYQISMAYAYWKANKHDEIATFDLYFRKNPFGGEFTLFAGLEECIKFVRDYKFHSTDIDYIRTILPQYVENEFLTYLLGLNMNDIKLYAVAEGTVVFPRIPLIRVEGPVLKAQLLETTLLTLVNYASLVATNAARFCAAAGQNKSLLEFGLRRAQGPDGGLSASKYCYLGGFHGTSNVLAGKLYGIPIKGTHAHAYVSSYSSMKELKQRTVPDAKTGEIRPFADLCEKYLNEVGSVLQIISEETNKGELAAFASYAIAFPTEFLALVDTYDVFKSGLPNFLAVARALHECNYRPIGLRLDSGDLAYISVEVRNAFIKAAKHFNISYFEKLTIVASNDINEDTLVSLEKQGHAIDSFGIGTHLVTCQKQPALGCVYKLVELDGIPRIKISQDIEKVTIPGRKNLYRLFGHDDRALCDLLTTIDEPPPKPSERILSRHPFSEQRRAYITPTTVRSLYKLYWADGETKEILPRLTEIRAYVKEQIQLLRKDHRRDLNPTPYKVSLTEPLFNFMHEIWMKSVPIGELR